MSAPTNTPPLQCQPFYDAAAEQRIVLPFCSRCAQFHWYPAPVCPHCQNPDWTWEQIETEATLFSWTNVRHSFHPELKGEVPFIVALVELDAAPGVRLVSNIVDADPDELTIGMPLAIRFEAPVWSEEALPVFAPGTATGGLS